MSSLNVNDIKEFSFKLKISLDIPVLWQVDNISFYNNL